MGISIKYKLKLLLCALAFSIPRRLTSKSSKLNRSIMCFANRVSNNTVINVNTTYFVLVDAEAFVIMLPTFEDWTYNTITPIKDGVFLDVGAHIGKYTLPLAREFGKVISIEAHPDNFKALKEGIRLNGLSNVLAINIAAWDLDGEIDLYVNEKSGWHSAKSDGGTGSIKVPARELDGLLADITVERLDWVKVDVEGAELEVLRGLKKSIINFKPKIIFENLGGSDMAGDFLKSNGYSIKALDQTNFLATPQ